MPIVLGLASSHAPSINLFAPDAWEDTYQRLKRTTPQPPEAAKETPEVLNDYIKRVGRSFGVLRDKLAESGAELLIIVGGDQNEMFDSSNKACFMIYLGDTTWGHNASPGQQSSEEDIVRLKVDVETSQWLLNKLVTEEGFDVSFSSEQVNLGNPDRGLPHAFIRPSPWLMPNLDIPTVILYENTYDAPSPSAARCYELGRRIARLLKDDPRRIAIYGSGGLSHDPGGPRSGWVDEPLDRWFLDQLAAGKGEATKSMYAFDSLTMRGGTGEDRAWITVAGAMEELGSRAEVVDYLPANHAVTGLGWAYWLTGATAAAK